MNKKLLAAIVAPFSVMALTVATGLSSGAVGVGEAPQSMEDTLISTLNVSTTVEVAPWCGWYVSTDGSTDLILAPADGEPTTYTGEEISLTSTGAENHAYVGSVEGLTSQPSSDGCSWFDDANKYGASYTVVADGDTFAAEAQLTGGAVADTGMNFTANDSNPFTIVDQGIDSCSTEGFSVAGSAEIKTGDLDTAPWSVLTASVNNNNFCTWSSVYGIKIPASRSPLYGNVDYVWTGPTLTHTLVIPEVTP
jgi:hypothetical protein